MLNINDFDNKIVILKDRMKNSFLELIDNNKKLLNIKIITLSELKNKYYFSYDKEAIYYICNKYNVISDIAKIYLDNVYYIDCCIDDEKVKFLYDLKQELISNNLLYSDNLFRKYLMNKNIVLFDLKYIDKFYNRIFDELEKNNNIERIDLDKDNGIKPLYEALNKEEEITFIASEICKLIKSGISINNIKLCNVNNDYYFTIKKIFNMFNIPFELKNNISIKGTNLVKIFKNNYNSDIKKTIDLINPLVINDSDRYIYKKIINVVNSYSFIDDYSKVKEPLFDDIDSINIDYDKYDNSIKVVDITSEIISEDDYVFLINFNEGVIPINHKDVDYLNDNVKSKLGISTSYELNNIESELLKSSIKRTKHLVITYSKYDINSELYISSIYDESLFKKEELIIEYDNSNKYNKIKLLSELDNNNKFGVISDDLVLLNNHYKEYEYLSYDNSYKLINKEDLLDYLKKDLTLSYSSVNLFYECAFKYYLSSVLKLNKYEDTFEIKVGNIFHKILCDYYNENIDFEILWKKEVLDHLNEYNNMEKYFLSKLKDELLLIIDTINEQLRYTSLKKSMFEREIVIPINSELNIKFKGFIDKVLYDEIDGMTIAVVIDYKTGNPELNLNNTVFGLNMQLPVYLYLLKNSGFNNLKIGGFYLQKILSNEKTKEERILSLKLQGYSNSDINILKYVDSGYENSHVIKSMKMTNNGFYSHAKVINDSEIDILYNIIDKNIKNASNDIVDCKFDINPKMIKNKNVSCNYCKYKDICYMNNDNIIKLEEVSNLFGGEEDGLD